MGKQRLVPHLIVEGGLDAIDFYERAFGAEKVTVVMAEDGERVMHAELEVNDGAFKLSDSFPEISNGMAAPGTAGAISVVIHLDFKKPKQIDEAIERAVKAGATLTMPAQDTFWGARYGRVRDPFGHVWALHALHKKKDPDEQ
ncbi:MAG TPA: VOC family protein [Geobacterales bacterium]|nr:VOC family protein [Geobacterales bacterium]